LVSAFVFTGCSNTNDEVNKLTIAAKIEPNRDKIDLVKAGC
jgi:hypothetical protein